MTECPLCGDVIDGFSCDRCANPPSCLVSGCEEPPAPGEVLCLSHIEEVILTRKLTRQERLEAQADAGHDTKNWEER